VLRKIAALERKRMLKKIAIAATKFATAARVRGQKNFRRFRDMS
jgi:hypothetical protein